MNVDLIFYSPKELILSGIRTCWKTKEKSDNFGLKDQNLIRKIIKKGHTSTLEHSLYTFYIRGVSRAILQEIARHRIGIGISVESTRYTLKKILNGEKIEEFLIQTEDKDLNNLIFDHFKKLIQLIKSKNLVNDIAKYGICENYPVTLQMSFNARSLRHFLNLRLSKNAHFEIRKLAGKFKDLIPEDHKIFFEDN